MNLVALVSLAHLSPRVHVCETFKGSLFLGGLIQSELEIKDCPVDLFSTKQF